MRIDTRVVLKIVGRDSMFDAEAVLAAVKKLTPHAESVELLVVNSKIMHDRPPCCKEDMNAGGEKPF